jgi:hypothetical protein
LVGTGQRGLKADPLRTAPSRRQLGEEANVVRESPLSERASP